MLEISVPDIGDFDEVEVVEILVAKGDRVEFDDPLVSIESDKATMEIPSTAAGIIADLQVAEGDRVSEGSVLVVIEADEEGEQASQEETRGGASASTSSAPCDPEAGSETSTQLTLAEPPPVEHELSADAANPVPDREGLPHASPLVRRYARELGVPIADTPGTGHHGRVLIDDLKRQVRDRFVEGGSNTTSQLGTGIPPMPVVDHSAFGTIREQPLTRIQKVSGPALHRSWLTVPHVTQHDEADVTALEKFRRDQREAASERGLKLSPLLFVMKAIVIALEEHPTFRASLAREGDRLLIKEYFHLGIAVDTDQGLVVPVIQIHDSCNTAFR